MNPLLYIEASLHFEIIDSEMYGGEGSVGYAKAGWGGVNDIEQINDELIDNTIKSFAGMLNVPVENVRVISKEEYDAATEDENTEDYEDDDLN